MKILFTIFITVLCLNCLAQNENNDVVYLKNGGIIKGTIIEYEPYKKVKIKISDGSIFVYKTEECDSIKKAVHQSNISVENESFINDNKEKKKADSIRKEAARIRRNTVPEKFSKKYYYACILECNTLIGQKKYDDFYYAESNDMTELTGINIINGLQFNKNYFLGLGIGLNFRFNCYTNSVDPMNRYFQEYVFLNLPIFIDFRYYFLNKKTQPFFNVDAGVILPFKFISGKVNRYDFFINPSIGVKALISPRNSINLSLGYSIFFNKATLITQYNDDWGYYYQDYVYDYMKHEVINQTNGINLKIGFTF